MKIHVDMTKLRNTANIMKELQETTAKFIDEQDVDDTPVGKEKKESGVQRGGTYAQYEISAVSIDKICRVLLCQIHYRLLMIKSL